MNEFLLSSAFIKRLLYDQPHIRQSKWKSLIKKTQLTPAIPLFRDRESEFMTFFNISRTGLYSLYLSHGFPNTRRLKCYLESFFEGRTASDKLKTAYENAAFYYSLRLMLAFERYSMISDYLDTLSEVSGKSVASLHGWRVLEYGCGVSDIGLLLGMLGADVTICDLEDKKLAFAEWRHQKRNIDVEVIPVDNTEIIPYLGKEIYDLIIVAEVFEHVRDPLLLLRSLTASLKSKGLLFDSMGGRFEREPGGDHLTEALMIGNSDDYLTFYQENYSKVSSSGKLQYLFQYKR
jgi:SAM-dependent methyltransferase